MELNALTAISPIDGRYSEKTRPLSAYFSEYALIRYRILVETEYFIALCNLALPQLQSFDKGKTSVLRSLYLEFDIKDAMEVKEIEKTTNHDIKAVEYFLKKKFDSIGLVAFKEFIHFGLTSQDINNVALPLMLRDAWHHIVHKLILQLLNKIRSLADEWQAVAMLARTHGQPASPTLLGKEFGVFAERIQNQLELLEKIPFSAKFGGATGNFNAHHIAYPDIDWISFANRFIENNMQLHRQQTTTQIEHYDYLAAWFDGLSRINTILIDLSRDIWLYVMQDYFKQKIKEGEIGSSAMPHKVNPIDFENAEGNLGIANTLLNFLSDKLPVSRLQRDLTDSTVSRNIGVAIAHTTLAMQGIIQGMGKLVINDLRIKADLESNWAVVAEAIQTILRREQVEGAYELLKELTRTNTVITKDRIHKFIEKLPVSDSVKQEMKRISPHNYTGISR
ncbi:MAG: adenylosuccinate lyase [Bacteroidales bacterium]|nr:adenylosuccinate lyase [Bacteroidales bacterium]